MNVKIAPFTEHVIVLIAILLLIWGHQCLMGANHTLEQAAHGAWSRTARQSSCLLTGPHEPLRRR
jgi:hypothetical protein